jgi:hypothetical protein
LTAAVAEAGERMTLVLKVEEVAEMAAPAAATEI